MNLAEFGSWGLAQGSVANPNGTYKGQCVSLIQQYLDKVLGVPYRSRGNAKDWVNNYPTNVFDKLSNKVALQPGDVLVYGKNYGGGYGHIGLIDINGKFYDQNGVKRKEVGYRDQPFKNYVCVLRPKDQSKLKRQDNQQSSRTRVFAVKTNIRENPTTHSTPHLYKANTKVQILAENVAQADGYTWDKVYCPATGRTGYVARTANRYK